MAGGRPKHQDVLTPAEWRVFDEVAAGRSNAEIAVRLGLSVNTVKYHVANILGKLEVPDRQALRDWRAPSSRGRLSGWLSGSGLTKVIIGSAALAACVGTGLVGLALLSDGPQAATSPSGRIAFVAVDSEGASSVRWVSADASEDGAVATETGQQYFSPAWSPDGSHIAYLAIGPAALPPQAKDSSVAALMLSTGDGLTVTTLADHASLLPADGVIAQPAWRPDSESILFTTQDFIASQVRADGTEYRDQLLGCTTSNWASFGTLGLCVLVDEQGSDITIGPVSSDFRYPETRVPTRLENPTYPTHSIRLDGVHAQPVMSDDGRWLAWWGHVPHEPPHVYAAPVQPDQQIRKDKMLDLGPGTEPSFAPGSHTIVFETSIDLAFPPKLGESQIVRYDLDRERRAQLTTAGANRWPAWSPDGQFIAFVSDRDEPLGEIYVMDAAGSNVVRVTRNGVAESMLDWAR